MYNFVIILNLQLYVEKMRFIFMKDGPEFASISHDFTRYINVDNTMPIQQLIHVYGSPDEIRGNS